MCKSVKKELRGSEKSEWSMKSFFTIAKMWKSGENKCTSVSQSHISRSHSLINLHILVHNKMNHRACKFVPPPSSVFAMQRKVHRRCVSDRQTDVWLIAIVIRTFVCSLFSIAFYQKGKNSSMTIHFLLRSALNGDGSESVFYVTFQSSFIFVIV